METINNKNIKLEIVNRYNEEASGCCTSLSCGQPLFYLNPLPDEILLDIGYGLGMEMIKAAQAVGENGKVYGIDVSPEMKKAAEKAAETNNINNCIFLIGDAENIPLDKSSIDGVFSNCVINHSVNKNKVYKEIYRILKPGGRLVIADIFSKDPLPEHIVNDSKMWSLCIGGAITKKEYLNIIKDAGFEDIQILKEELSRKKQEYNIYSFTFSAYKK